MPVTKVKILVVDDEELIGRLVVRILGGLGYEVHAMSDPLQAAAVLAETAFDLLITDVQMPKMSGLELILEAKSLQPDLRVVIMSGYFNAEGLECDHPFLRKPFSSKDLGQAVALALGTGEAGDER